MPVDVARAGQLIEVDAKLGCTGLYEVGEGIPGGLPVYRLVTGWASWPVQVVTDAIAGEERVS